MAIWIGLATDRLCALITPRSPKRAIYSLLCASRGSSVAAARCRKPTRPCNHPNPYVHRHRAGQAHSVAELQPQSNLTSDYDLSGMLDIHLPDIAISHAWGDVSRRGYEALPDLLRAAQGGHYLTVRPSAPMIYNLRPDARQLSELAASLGIQSNKLALQDAEGSWAELLLR